MQQYKKYYFFLATFLAIITSFLFFAIPSNIYAATGLPSGFTDNEFTAGLNYPTQMAFAPDGRLFVSEKEGNLRVIKNGALLQTPFLTVNTNTSGERGLIGVTFDPNFLNNGYLYIYYTSNAITPKNRVARFKATNTNPDIAQPGSETILLDNIPADGGNHNAGSLHFGPDGKLYISTGDAGSGTNSQNLNSLAGKILRINSDGSIPSDNPFADQSGKKAEIWSYGLRNPFTFTIDQPTGNMFIADVGEGLIEEIDQGVKGANYGWPTCEGTCSTAGFTNPIYQYDHSVGHTVISGEVYNANQFPTSFKGKYFFADYDQSWIKILDTSSKTATAFGDNLISPVDLDIGPDGALYYLSIDQGSIHKITYGTQKAGDINNDGNVNVIDYGLFVADFNSTSGVGLRSDIDHSGKVDVIDYGIFVGNFGK